ncbi:MAG: glycosyltransferase family 9 protein [Akkermansiaceae bacterium]|nr:glycosyltransferase family 9 protein [Akkermansiaceae bacterium]
MERILIIKHGALGDVVLALGCMQALKRRHPEAHMTLMTMKPFVPIAEQAGVFDAFIVDNRRSFFCLSETRRVLAELVGGRFDLIYNLQYSQRTRHYRRLLRWLAPRGVYRWVDASAGLCHTITKTRSLGPGHEALEPAELPQVTTDLRFLHGEGKHFDRLPERYVLLIPGCSPQHPYKRWPVASYREVVRRLAERGIAAVVLGTAAEAAEAEAICAGNPTAVNMVGLTSLLDVPQVALRALAVVGNDTGPSHMAALTGVYTLAIFDRRNARSVLRGHNCTSLVSEGEVALVTPERVWEHLAEHLPAAQL